MMRLLVAICFLSISNVAFALEAGTYLIGFRISDELYFQKIELSNFRESPNKTFVGFDVHLEEQGSLKRFPSDSQVVQGVVYMGKFKFIIPFADVINVYGFNFVGVDELVDGSYKGDGEVSWDSSHKSDTYKFSMSKDPR